jgi:septal ring factor EnvC (AmiA/AmiB activator)
MALSKFKRGIIGAGAALTLIGLLGTIELMAANAPTTVFSRLEEAGARAHAARGAADRLETVIGRHDKKIAETLEELDITRRATVRLQKQLIRNQIAWERADRAHVRGARGWRPGASSDLERLLDHAAPEARRARREEHELVAALDVGRQRVQELVNRQSSLIIELAQQKGRADAADASHAGSLEAAKKASPEEIDRDLSLTEEELAREMGLMLQNPTQRDFHRLKGTLVPPVSKSPTHTYGPRKQRSSSSYVRHTGYTYEVEPGTEVKSTAGGLVVYAERFEGYGRVVIVDHGSSYHSLYAHLDKIEVEPGQKVDRGEKLATSGSSGSLEGPKLYFELRHKGLPINPSSWFIRLR